MGEWGGDGTRAGSPRAGWQRRTWRALRLRGAAASAIGVAPRPRRSRPALLESRRGAARFNLYLFVVSSICVESVHACCISNRFSPRFRTRCCQIDAAQFDFEQVRPRRQSTRAPARADPRSQRRAPLTNTHTYTVWQAGPTWMRVETVRSGRRHPVSIRRAHRRPPKDGVGDGADSGLDEDAALTAAQWAAGMQRTHGTSVQLRR